MKTFFFFIHALAQSNAIQFRADETLPLEQQTSPDYTTYVLILIGIIFVGYFIVTKRRITWSRLFVTTACTSRHP